MKSDEEFLEGIYEKVGKLSKQSQESEVKTKHAKQNVIFLRVGEAAAIFLFICSAGIFMQEWRKEAMKNEQHTPNVTSIRMEVPGVTQQLVQEATDIIEVEALQGEGNTTVIHQIYKASADKEALLSALAKNAVTPDPERKLLVFLKIDSNTSEILDVMVEDEVEGTYANPLTGTITKEELETYISDQAVE